MMAAIRVHVVATKGAMGDASFHTGERRGASVKGEQGIGGGVRLSGRGWSSEGERRGRNVCIVAASPLSNDSSNGRIGAPLTRQDLVAYLASGCKPKEKCRIGTEHEKFGFQLDTLQPMTYDQIRLLLEDLAERFEWQRVMEGDNIIGLTFKGQSVSLEPGG